MQLQFPFYCTFQYDFTPDTLCMCVCACVCVHEIDGDPFLSMAHEKILSKIRLEQNYFRHQCKKILVYLNLSVTSHAINHSYGISDTEIICYTLPL